MSFQKRPAASFVFTAAVSVMLACGGAFAQTPEELYNDAVGKYILDDYRGSVSVLEKLLLADPENVKAAKLLDEVNAEESRIKEESKSETPAVSGTLYISRQIREGIEKAELKAREKTAHELFSSGENMYLSGDLVGARELFRKVIDILPGHQPSVKYVAEITDRLMKAPGVQAPAKPRQPRAENSILPALLFATVTTLAAAALAGLIAVLIMFLRRESAVCVECGSRNAADSEFCRKCGQRLVMTELTEEQGRWFSKFGWSKNPFTLSIIPDAFAGHKAEIAMIIEKLNTLSGHILVTGGLGTGKSTLLQWLEKNMSGKFDCIYIMRPSARPDDLIDLVSAFLTGQTSHTRKYSIYDFQELCARHKKNILLLIDEAHEFTDEAEQFLRTLGDLPNVFLVMAGLPQVREKLKAEMPALLDRMVENIMLGSLSEEETQELILKRISNAGGSGLGPMTAGAVQKVHGISRGIPRAILKICDWAVAQSITGNKYFIDTPDIESYLEHVKEVNL